MIRVILTAVVALAVGLYGGYQAARDVNRAPETAAAVQVSRAVTEPVSCQATLAPADVELLKRELVSAIAHSTTAPSVDIEQRTAVPHLETDDVIEANESLQYVLDGAVANGVWTDEDAMAMSSLMRRASPHAVDKAMSTLAAAINDQQLRVATQGFPF